MSDSGDAGERGALDGKAEAVENVLGRATIAFWSTDGSASWVKPWTWFTAARWERMGKTW